MCWNSDSGTPQWIEVEFGSPVSVSAVQLQFQGGFVGQDCTAIARDVDGRETVGTVFDPDDSNDLQTFPCDLRNVASIRVQFGRSTDFYGRITLYRFDVLG